MSSDDEWSDGSVWSYVPADSRLNVRGRAAQCLTASESTISLMNHLIWSWKEPKRQFQKLSSDGM